jgi:hypothetical protein
MRVCRNRLQNARRRDSIFCPLNHHRALLLVLLSIVAAASFCIFAPFVHWLSQLPHLLPAAAAFAVEIFVPASSLYASNSSLVWAFSRLCKITTDAVVMNTAIAAPPAIPDDRSINCSQECRSSPNIRLTLLEKAIFLVLAASAACILTGMVWVMVVFRWERDANNH